MAKFSAKPLSIADVLLIAGDRSADARGHFMETYNRRDYAPLGIECEFVQDNRSLSVRRGTVRGLHFQCPPKPQAKLVSVLNGAIFDVAVDIRRGSPTFGGWCGATLTAESAEQIFVPRGFAHAYCTLEPNTAVIYKVDGYYAPTCDAGIVWNDPDISIHWPIAPEEVVLSAKDANLPRLADIESPFVYGAQP
jgi:dTDP-4-dehydrorhamnose 3,5-epimerase